MKIKIYDIIGLKSGMNHYVEAFCNVLIKNGIESEVCSNYVFNGKKFFPNIFQGSIFKKILMLILAYWRYFTDIIKLNKSEYGAISVYGHLLDIPFLIISSFNKNIFIDIHEVVSLDNKSRLVHKIFNFIYRHIGNSVISHSNKTDIVLEQFGFKNHIFKVPLFNYNIDQSININNLDTNLIEIVKASPNYILFFGNIRPSKGIFELLEALKIIGNRNISLEYKVIIAGQDNSGIIDDYQKVEEIKSNAHFIVKYVNDDETNYLFENCSLVILPYKEISQSAILEMAFAFRKPIITSKIKYFNELLIPSPSFGYSINVDDPDVFAEELIKAPRLYENQVFYTVEDIDKFQKKDEVDAFILDLRKSDTLRYSKS